MPLPIAGPGRSPWCIKAVTYVEGALSTNPGSSRLPTACSKSRPSNVNIISILPIIFTIKECILSQQSLNAMSFIPTLCFSSNKTTSVSVVLVDFQVRVGAHSVAGGIVIAVVKCKIHPFYNPMTLDNDIALLKLDVLLDFSDPHVQPICLTTRDFPEWTTCTVTGWGAILYRKWSVFTYRLTSSNLSIYNTWLLSCYFSSS